MQTIVPDLFVKSEERFRVPFNLHHSFVDVMLYKISMDAGNVSTKGLINVVNVDNPQGMEHVRPFLEFLGVKDSHENVRRAAFKP